MRTAAGGLGLTLAASVGVVGGASPSAAAPPVDDPVDAAGITVEDWAPHDVDVLDPDNPPVYEAVLSTDAIYAGSSAPAATPKVRVFFPDGYDPERTDGYDVLYLLHGGVGKWSDWSEGNNGQLLHAVEDSGYDGIVVMPEGGRSGWYQDWVGNTSGGFRPLWETFHVDQLVPWVDANFNTDDTAGGRTIGGVSMGGLGALKYAARHPSVFGSVVGFSAGTDMNALDTSGGDDAAEIINNALAYGGAGFEFTGWSILGPATGFDVPTNPMDPTVSLEHVFGPDTGWEAINPQDIAEDGGYAPFDGSMVLYTGDTGGDANIKAWNEVFSTTLVNGNVSHDFCVLPGQDHNWTNWQQQLNDYLRQEMGQQSAYCSPR